MNHSIAQIPLLSMFSLLPLLTGCDDLEPFVAADFSAEVTTGPAPLVVQFMDGSTSSSNVGITEHTWSFGDGETGTEASPTHTYTEPGTYTVELIVSGVGNDGNGVFSDSLQRRDYIVVTAPATGEDGKFQVHIAREGADTFLAAAETDTGESIILTRSFGPEDATIIRTYTLSPAGAILDTHVNNIVDGRTVVGGQVLQDGCTLVLGRNEGGTNGSTSDDALVVLINPEGEQVYESVFDLGMDIEDTSSVALPQENGGLVIGGTTLNQDDFSTGVFIAQLDANGNTVWRNLVEGPGNTGDPVQIIETPDGFTVSATSVPGPGGGELFLFDTDHTGALIDGSMRVIPDLGFTDYRLLPDFGFLTAGNRLIPEGGGSTTDFIAHYDSTGKLLRDQAFQSSEPGLVSNLRAPRRLPNGDLLVGGQIIPDGGTEPDVYVATVDAVGIGWERNYGGPLAEFHRDALPTADGGSLIGGTTRSFGATDADIYVVRSDAAGDAGPAPGDTDPL